MGFRRRRWLWQDKLIQRERTDPAKVFSLFPKSDNQPLQSNKALQQTSYERLFVKFCLQKNRKKVDNQQKMIPKGCFCLAPIRVL